MNKVYLLGHLGDAPEITHYQNSRKAVFSLATTRKFKKGEELHTETTWHQVHAWNIQADIMEKMAEKGTQVLVEGRINHRTWKDDHGNNHYFTEIIAERVTVLRNRKGEPRPDQGAEVVTPEVVDDRFQTGDKNGDDLPF
jgi:single-strand DNA-binding protein